MNGRRGTIDLTAAASFMATHARLLDRRRFRVLLDDGGRDDILAALDAYRNPDGGYGWGLEPDLRSSESQPAAALHAFEALAEVAPATTPRAGELCDWLASASLADGGLPFALPVADPAGVAPFWAQADATRSSLQITAFVTAVAHRLAEHDRAVAGHPWLARATRYCLAAIDALDDAPHALVLTAAVRFLDAVHDTDPETPALLRRLGTHVPRGGVLHVEGGTEEEMMRPLDLAPAPHRPARAVVTAEAIAADLRRLRGEQQDDGGWRVDFASHSPAAVLDWRGYMTVHALSILRANAGG